MFRCTKEIQISALILESKQDAILNWLNILADELQTTPNRLISGLFLTIRSNLDDESINKLHNFSLDTKRRTKPMIIQDKFSSLPRDIFVQIGSYLTINSRLNLSLASRLYHKLVQNRDYFNKMEKFELSPKQLKIIYDNNCDLECAQMCDYFCITRDEYMDCRDNNSDHRCVLSKIIFKIQENDNKQNINNSSCNSNSYCRLNWFKGVLNNTTKISVSNNWSCAFSHLPMEWIFDINNNNNNTVCIRSIQFYLSSSATKTFGASYDLYWNRKSSPLDNRSSSNDKNDKNDEVRKKRCAIGKDIRAIGDIGIRRSDMTFRIACQLHGNYEKFRLRIPSSNRVNKFDTLKEFFTVFHPRLKTLRIYFDKIIRTTDIISQIFDNNNNSNNKQLIKDLNTPETQLSFDNFLKKYNCQLNQLPQIREIFLRGSVSHGIFSMNNENIVNFFHHDKLMKLLNFFNTVKTLGFSFIAIKNKFTNEIKNGLFKLVNKLNDISKIEFNFTIKEKCNVDEKIVHQFFSEFLTDVIVECLVNYNNINAIEIVFTVNAGHPFIKSKTCDLIEIGSKQQLLIGNRKNLIHDVQMITQQLSKDVIKEWNQRKVFLRKLPNANGGRISQRINLKRNFCL